jgi:hypothetical protein
VRKLASSPIGRRVPLFPLPHVPQICHVPSHTSSSRTTFGAIADCLTVTSTDTEWLSVCNMLVGSLRWPSYGLVAKLVCRRCDGLCSGLTCVAGAQIRLIRSSPWHCASPIALTVSSRQKSSPAQFQELYRHPLCAV